MALHETPQGFSQESNMIPCRVDNYFSALLVSFPGCARELLIQTDWDQASFCQDCGLIDTNLPSSPAFVDCDPTDIHQCPDNYLEVACD
jgi:hypothetical protein